MNKLYSIKFKTEDDYVEEYPNGYDDSNFFKSMRKNFSTKKFPIHMKGYLELGTSGDCMGEKFDETFTSFETLIKWVNDKVFSLNYAWTR